MMGDTEIYRINYSDSVKNPGLLEKLFDLKGTLKVLLLEFALSSGGVGLMVSGTRDTAMLHQLLGADFEAWINRTSETIGNMPEIQNALLELEQIMIAFANSNKGGEDNG